MQKESKITVLSYNLASCYGLDQKLNPLGTLEMIQRAQADLTGMQEISYCYPCRGNLDFPKMAADALKQHALFGSSLFFNGKDKCGGEYGNGVLSVAPIEQVELLHYDLPDRAEPRSALIVKVLAAPPYYFVVTHLPFQGECEGDEEMRVACLKALQERILEKHYYPVILTGDLNSKPHSAPIEFLRKEWSLANDMNGDYPPTACSQNEGEVHIDYIGFFPRGAFRVARFERFGEKGPSDHYPVRAELIRNEQ